MYATDVFYYAFCVCYSSKASHTAIKCISTACYLTWKLTKPVLIKLQFRTKVWLNPGVVTPSSHYLFICRITVTEHCTAQLQVKFIRTIYITGTNNKNCVMQSIFALITNNRCISLYTVSQTIVVALALFPCQSFSLCWYSYVLHYTCQKKRFHWGLLKNMWFGQWWAILLS